MAGDSRSKIGWKKGSERAEDVGDLRRHHVARPRLDAGDDLGADERGAIENS